jgi:hypothetical protein
MEDYMFWYVDLSGTSNDYILEAEEARKLLRDNLLDLDLSEDDERYMIDEIDSFIEDHIEGSEFVQDGSFKIVCFARKTLRRMKGGK